LVLALPLLAVVLITGLGFVPQTDEAKFHWDVIQQFADEWPAIPWGDYHAATTPLPYIMWALWGKLFGFGLPALRALTLLISYAGVLTFYALARRQRHEWPLAESLLVLFSPYVFLNSFTIYTVNMGLPFEVLALWFYLKVEKPSEWRALLWGSVAATAAIYCRQHYVFLPAGMGLWWAFSCWRARRMSWSDLRNLALIILPVVGLLPLIVVWGGLTPPAFQSLHPLTVNLAHVNFLLIVIGLYAAPAVIAALPTLSQWGWRTAWLALCAPAYVWFRPYYEQGANALSSSEQGIILHALDLGRQVTGALAPALGELILWVNGVLIGAESLARAWKRGDSESIKLWSWVIAFAGMLAVSDFVGERFYVLLVPIWLILFYPRLAGRRVIVALWVAGMAIMGVTYSVVKMNGG
jgi:hypothetical protein